MGVMKPRPGMRPATTNGWDVVSAVKIGVVNEAIANAGTSPKSFSQEVGPQMWAEGSFGDWTIGEGGDGHLLNLVIPIRDVAIHRGTAVETLPEALVKVRVRLALMPTGAPPRESSAGIEREFMLVLRTDIGPELAELAELEAVPSKVATVIQMDGDEELGIMSQALLTTALDTWLNTNLHQFHHVFATVNVAEVSRVGSSGALDWLQLTSVSYAFGHNSSDPEEGVLAILGQTEGRSMDGLINQAQAEMIPERMNAGMCISRSRFLRNMLLPGIPAAFQGLKLSDVKIKARDAGLYLKKDVKLDKMEHEGETYEPILELFDLDLRETDVIMKSHTATEVSPGLFSLAHATSTYAYGMDWNSKGEKTMKFEEVGKPKLVRNTRQTPGRVWTNVGLAVAGAIAGVAAVFTGGTSLIVASMLFAALGVGITASNIIEGDDGPSIDLLMTNATNSVTWSTGAKFDPQFMALNGGLQIGGDFLESRAVPESGIGLSERAAYQKAFQERFARVMSERAPQ